MSDLIDLLAKKRLIWQGRDQPPSPEFIPSGYALLDEKLGGLPKIGVMAIHSQQGIGELRLLMHTLAQQSRLIVFINPPGNLAAEGFYHQGFDLSKVWVIYPRKKNEALWAAEQCSKSGACGAVLLWQNAFEIHQIKRFQMACEEGQCQQFLMRSSAELSTSLPVSLSMLCLPNAKGLDLSITKRKGGWPIPEFTLDMSTHWPAFSIGGTSPHGNVIPFPSTRAQQGVS